MTDRSIHQGPSWRTPGEAIALVVERRLLRRTLTVALSVGTVLSLINQGHLMFGGGASIGTWVRVGANFIVPFLVSNIGALVATRR